MTCPSDISGWAGNILDSLGETSITTGSVYLWLTNSLGSLNDKLNTNFYINDSGCIESGLGSGMNSAHSGIYTEMYFCYYLSRQATKRLGAAEYDWTEIDGDEEGSVRRVSKNEQAKTYRLLAKDCNENLNSLVAWYKRKEFEPKQVLYNDRTSMADGNLIYNSSPPESYYSPHNFIWVEV